MKYLSIIIALAIAICGCESELKSDLGLNEYTSEVVITGAIAPGIQPRVRLTMSLPTLDGRDFPLVDNAFIEVSAGDQIFDLQYEGDGYYSTDRAILPESIYEIQASVPQFNPVVATATVPSMVQVHSFERIDTLFLNDFGNPTGRLSFVIDDPANEANYYEFILYSIYDGAIGMLPIRTGNPSVENAGSGDILGTRSTDFIQKFLITDRIFDGQSFKLELDFLVFDNELPIVAHIKSLSHDYYRYLETVYDASEGKDNPFIEPISVVGNVEGGQGIFGGYTLHEEVLE
ncbi:MAG: DUF4249 domain-containing protein [Cyclobacteriaceae bacterium]